MSTFRLTLASLAICAMASTTSAQLPNDECTGALPIIDGMNAGLTNTGATNSPEGWPCGGSSTAALDVWYSYTATGNGDTSFDTCSAATNFDTRLQAYDGQCGALTSIVCNDDACGLQSRITIQTVAGTVYYICVAGYSGASGNFDLNVSPARPILEGVAEFTLNSGTLSSSGSQAAFDGAYLRWNLPPDPAGLNTGLIAGVCMNIGIGGSAPTGTNPLAIDFHQLWAGSIPPGFGLWLPPNAIGAGEYAIPAPIPAGILNLGDTIRIQALMIDPVLFPAHLGLGSNAIEFTMAIPCMVGENFDSLPPGTGNYPTGWANGGGVAEWTVDAGGTTSGGTGPTSAVSVPNYMYCETSSPRAQGDTFIMNTASYSNAIFVHNVLKFQLSRVGATIGTLEVRMDDGTGTYATLLATYTGEEPNGLEWTEEVINLPTPLPANVSFQFHYSRGSSYTGDIAIDDFCLQ